MDPEPVTVRSRATSRRSVVVAAAPRTSGGAALILLGATNLGVELGLLPSTVHGLTGPMMLVLFGLFVLPRAIKSDDGRSPQASNKSHDRPRVYYTCGPFGGVMCGASRVAIGIALLLQEMFPASPEIVWGVMLVVLGAGTILWHTRRGDS